MCLATVYEKKGEEKVMLCKNIASITEKDGKLIFTDILGVVTSYTGLFEKIDLMDNYIYVKNREEQNNA